MHKQYYEYEHSHFLGVSPPPEFMLGRRANKSHFHFACRPCLRLFAHQEPAFVYVSPRLLLAGNESQDARSSFLLA
jgi:hypothetical protein